MSKDKDKTAKSTDQPAKAADQNQQAGNSTQPVDAKPDLQVKKPVFPKGPGIFIRTGAETFEKVEKAKKADGQNAEKPGDK